MGSGSATAATKAIGYASAGLEIDAEYFHLAEKASPLLPALYPQFKGQAIEIELNGNVEPEVPESQLALTLAERPPAYGRPNRAAKK